jgi:hypothetical protein
MKKIRISIIFVAFFTFFVAGSVEDVLASQQLENMQATVGVNAVFSISATPPSLDFGSVDPGTTTPAKDLYVTCSTNNNNPWSVSIGVLSELTSGTFTMPNEEFNWWGWTPGGGTWHVGTGYLSTAQFTFYEASSDEYITSSPIELHLTFNIDVPSNQPAGTYATTIVLTMSE